jgi:aminopeptidase YwaD
MFEPLLEAVRAEASGERALESVRALARFHRVQASPGYDEAAGWLVERLEDLGFEPEIETVPGDGRTRCLGHLMPEGWACERALATLIDGDTRERLCDVEAERLSLVLRSSAARGRFGLVVLDDGTHAEDYTGIDVRGRVVVTRGAVQPVHALAVVERGAAGILYDGRRLVPPVRDRFEDPDALAYTSFWWGERDARGWGFVVGPRTGERLRERLAAGAPLTLEVEIDARAFPTPIPLVSARIAPSAPAGGPASDVLVLAHLCHPQPSANDNGSGVAAALETARVLGTLASRGALGPMRRGIRFLWMPEMTGTYAWLARDPARARALIAAVNLDMVGQDQARCGSTFLLEHPPCFAASFAEELLLRIRAEAVDWVPSYSGPGHYSMTRMAEVPYSGGSDHYVLIDPATGVPCPMLIQWPDRYYHSSYDTPDKTSPASLALAVRCAATYAGFLATAGAAETAWLTDAVRRGAEARMLRAADRPAPAPARERERGRRALASLERLGVGREAIADADRALDDLARREHLAVEPPARARAASTSWIPRRALPVPIHYQRHLLEHWDRLPAERREAWERHMAEVADAQTLIDLAWYACDGERDLNAIIAQVALETGREEPELIAGFFALTEALGLSARVEEDACSPAAPGTATR